MKENEKFSKRRQLGNLAEDIAEVFLVKSGFTIIDRNYLRKCGELDIVAKIRNIIHFIEVKGSFSRERDYKSVSRIFSQNSFTKDDFKINLSRVTGDIDGYSPEENFHYQKQKRMKRAIETYIMENSNISDFEWEVDLITVTIDLFKKEAIIKHIENIVFDV